jgi:gamma-glutamyltranspeptidase/glutathione hydrolase
MNNVMPVAYRGMVATPHHLASSVGCSILQLGGNAFDASIAISAALAVVYPHMTGVGGDAFFLIYDANKDELRGLNGSGRSGSKLTPAHYLGQGMKAIPRRGMSSSITVPGMVDAWWEVWSAYGKLAWEKLLEPAVYYAEHGVPTSRDLHRCMVKNQKLLLSQQAMQNTFMPLGFPFLGGEKLLQPKLARTLKAISSEGRAVFYEGSLMQEIVDSLRAEGGSLIEQDFRDHRSEWVQPISSVYREHTIVQMPPNSQGFSALMMMNMLEKADISAIPRDSAEFYHLVTEVIKKAFNDRDRYLTDPDFFDIPLERLLSKDYAAELYQNIHIHPYKSEPFLSKTLGQDTAYAAVVDSEGNAVSFIQSLYSAFGSGCMAGDTGIIMQNRGSYFSLNPGDANVLAPGKRTFHTLMPGMIMKKGKPFLLMGTQGGEGQPQTQLSLLTGVLDYGCTIQEAIALPRWVYGRAEGDTLDTLRIENRGLDAAIGQLAEWGHAVRGLEPWDPAVGQAQGIMLHPDGGLSGAADPRGDGLAIGW